MSIEVEIKAWVHDSKKLKELLDREYHFEKEYFKEDIYLKGIDSVSGLEKGIRLRRVGSESIVTYKERSHQEKVEVNLEKEFNIDDPDNFLFIIDKLGYKPYIRKSKRGYLYIKDGINIELSYVDGLGDFVEIENIVNSKEEVKEATKDIYKILDDLKISRDFIEDKFYVQMLQDKKKMGS
ncbi:MAG: class IV adenylate cyclase [Spirochaetaceae bacterium]